MSLSHTPPAGSHHIFRSILTAAFIVVVAASCADEDRSVDPVAPGQSAVPTVENAQTQARQADRLPILKRFDVAVEATGTFRPGAPVTLQIHVTGLSDVASAELRVVLPEISAAAASDWGEGFRYPPVGEPVDAVLSHTFNVRRSASSDFTVTVEVPAEGYYKVVTSLRAPEDTPIVEGGRWALNTMVDESWLLITEAGGALTETFEPDRIPSNYLQESGPFRSSRAPVSRRNPQGPPAESVLSGPSAEGIASIEPMQSGSNEITYQIKYYDDDAVAFQPLPKAYFIVYLCTLPSQQFICETEDFEQYDSGVTDSNGYVSFPCQEDEYILEVSTFRTGRFRVNHGFAGAEGDVGSDCGNSFDRTMQSTKAKIFRNLYTTVDGTLSLFGEARSFISVWEDAENEHDNSYYDPGADEIHILTDLVWDDFGAFITAHEYGHAFHEDALLGNAGGCGGEEHFLDTESSLECAFSEGFADYFGSMTRPDLTGWAAYFEDNDAFPGCVSRDEDDLCDGGTSYEGSLIEGAFAALLYDLTDDPVEAHDSIAAPGSYVADLIRTCEHQDYQHYGFWDRADGADHFAYCAENSINPGSCFTARFEGTDSIREAAQEPTGWTSNRVNEMWHWNMYEKPDSTVSC